MKGKQAVAVSLLVRGAPVKAIPLLALESRSVWLLTPVNLETWKQVWQAPLTECLTKWLGAVESPHVHPDTLLDLIRPKVGPSLGFHPGKTLPDRPFAGLGNPPGPGGLAHGGPAA